MALSLSNKSNHKKKDKYNQNQNQKGLDTSNSPSGGSFQPSCSQDPTHWYCYGFGETYGQSYNGNIEYGNDNDTPYHTNLYAWYGGQVTDASYQPWGGQVGISTNVPGYGNLIYYEQHLDLIDSAITPGSQVLSGQYLGLSGGQIGYGYHPSEPQYSTGPHTESGFGAPWINGAQGCSFGQSCNPNSNFAFQQARAGLMPSNTSNPGGPISPGGGGPFDPCTYLPWLCQLQTLNWADIGIRFLLVGMGMILVFIGFNKLFSGGGMNLKLDQPPQQPQPEKEEKATNEKEESSTSQGEEEAVEEAGGVA